MSNFTATTIASDAAEALAKVTKYVGKVDGFSVTGRVAVRSERHMLWTVEIANEGGDRNDLWVVLTSYGMNPSKALGSTWQSVVGVGA